MATKPMRLTCLRHGATTMNLAGRFNGMSQEGITEEQRGALGSARFDDGVYDVIYCSHLKRCVETATALGISQWITDERIAERNLGVFEGHTPIECEQKFPDEFKAFTQFDGDFVIPRGESRVENLARVLDWLEEASRHECVLAVTHGGTIDFLYRLGTGSPTHGGTTIYAGSNASVSLFEVDWPAIRLLDYDMPLSGM